MTKHAAKRVDVAISFARPDILVADEIARRLGRRNVLVYHFTKAIEETLGEELRTSLKSIYSSATLVLILLSKHYGTPFTEVELEAALAGTATERGIILVRLDDSPIPLALEGRAYITLERGTDVLVHAVLRKMRRASFSAPLMLLVCLGASAAGTLYIVVGLGFHTPLRWPDWLLHVGTVSPLLWATVFRVGPVIVQRHRARSLQGAALLQTPTLARLDYVTSGFGFAIALLVVLSIAGGTLAVRNIQSVHANRATLLRDLEADYRNWYRAAAQISALGSKASTLLLPAEVGASRQLLESYERALADLRVAREQVESLTRGREEVGAFPGLPGFLEMIQQTERILDTYIGYQVRRLAEPRPASLAEVSFLHRRRGYSSLIGSYSELLNSTLIGADDEFAELRMALQKNLETYASSWRGLLSNEKAAGSLRMGVDD